MKVGASVGPVIAVVGASGVGKDSLMEALAARDPRLCLMRRVVTRAPEAGGEDYDAVSEDAFCELVKAGHFALHWHAHGLHYGIPLAIEDLRAQGHGVLVNLSRAVLATAQEVFGDLIVLSVTARPEILAERLTKRGREDSAEVQRRLARAGQPLPAGLLRLHEIDNSGDLGLAVAQAKAAIYSADAPLPVRG
ncbi:phosphonate metabolism protein/1,5-bisphosphokinase (PRPP-forming) PhnN [Pseudophaeobacter flagellatus]|uniref:phosphonate metabolism protein/1,5-bisphosphokinase (PRPP-forming) PhnN n=1 Tax=Pseudophaeobacter flagellatus TaxID=2899119 RepID=UPI001E2F38FD|nr:phosphonate metabolism protein/1,5-bisphosphokinase (PRPP-forming) PhnN [Pseudophaeobacter flagellatus]MCD9149142.1 phosphonate metabolism protein/1,5-bisphosphokinase (PRPP-forming) PhnN [Pseudophaeobacter flagellatus]